jgi:hypothetical protein
VIMWVDVILHSYEPISLIGTVEKLLEKILISRIVA